ncbi:hypothetical protein ACJ72_08446 [Emergomyces africanus]|uniref:PNPLA domain-containing protein n=1 Tax=Emergomyces africanus TaxID=1955775 RepID=A0A1B7NKF7_9EURO|nr:hypothetical protein ACJ72_08446 [Emergomyces africanus]
MEALFYSQTITVKLLQKEIKNTAMFKLTHGMSPIARATSAAPVLLPSVNIAGKSYQDGGVRSQNNNPLLLELSEVRRLWPTTPIPDVVVSLETCSALMKHSPAVSRFRNVLMDGMLLRGYQSINSSYDGEESWKQIKNLLPSEVRSEKTFLCLNVPFPPGNQPSMSDAGAMDTLSQVNQNLTLDFFTVLDSLNVELLLELSFICSPRYTRRAWIFTRMIRTWGYPCRRTTFVMIAADTVDQFDFLFGIWMKKFPCLFYIEAANNY